MIDELSTLKDSFRKLELPAGLLQAYRQPPADPARCVFALTTQTISADLRTMVTPCQLGGEPDCRQCGCVAAAAMEAVSRHRLPIGIRAGAIFRISRALGLYLKTFRDAGPTQFNPRWEGALRTGASLPARNPIAHPGRRHSLERDAPKMRA